MKKIGLIFALLMAGLLYVSAAQPQLQHVECGSIERMCMFSPQMNDTLTIDIWLPEEYVSNPQSRYPVIYMHDGQNLFDATTTWNGQSWEMDQTMCNLIQAHRIRPAIIVGVHSFAETRVADLMPQKAVSGFPLEALLNEVNLNGMTIRGDAYAAFIACSLKPAIDATYRTLPGVTDTSVMGSSMGGLMSVYILCEYPEIFGNALCLSTHWTGTPSTAKEFEETMYRYIDANLPSPDIHRLYFDHGTETIDAGYGPAEERILKMIKEKGYSYNDGTLLNMVDYGASHEERAWAARVAIPLEFVLGIF